MIQAIELTVPIFLLILGASYLVQSERWLQFLKSAFEKPWQLFPTAIAMIAGGVFIGVIYNDWSSTWPIFITILAWLMALEGALLLIFPGFLEKLGKLSDHFLAWYLRAGGLLLIVLGVLLLRHWGASTLPA